MAAEDKRSRSYIFTWNNPEWDVDKLAEKFGMTDYIIIGEEVGNSGTFHYQGYVEFKNARTIHGLKSRIHRGIHWEPRMGTPTQAAGYIKNNPDKPNPIFKEWGVLPGVSGARNDIKSMVEMINEGYSDADILLQHGDKALRIMGCLQKARAAMNTKYRDWEMRVDIKWGPKGSGKTSSVYEEFGYEQVYAKMPGKWWDGYKGETVVLIDDFDPLDMEDMSFAYYLKLLDRYPLRIEMKGGSCQFVSRVIVITSNFNPEEWFMGRANRDAFFRRVTSIEHVTGENST